MPPSFSQRFLGGKVGRAAFLRDRRPVSFLEDGSQKVTVMDGARFRCTHCSNEDSPKVTPVMDFSVMVMGVLSS